MIEVSVHFKRTFYWGLCLARFQGDHANRYQVNFWKNYLKKSHNISYTYRNWIPFCICMCKSRLCYCNLHYSDSHGCGWYTRPHLKSLKVNKKRVKIKKNPRKKLQEIFRLRRDSSPLPLVTSWSMVTTEIRSTMQENRKFSSQQEPWCISAMTVLVFR